MFLRIYLIGVARDSKDPSCRECRGLRPKTTFGTWGYRPPTVSAQRVYPCQGLDKAGRPELPRYRRLLDVEQYEYGIWVHSHLARLLELDPLTCAFELCLILAGFSE